MSVSSLAPLQAAAQAPLRAVRLGTFDIAVERRPDGVLLVRPTNALDPYPKTITAWLDHWAQNAPDRAFLVERDAAGAWRAMTYAEVLREVRRIGAALLRCDLSPDRPVAILSGNDIDHALQALAAMYVGIPYAPISPAYSLLSSDFGKLRSIMSLVTPGLVFANDGTPFGRAIEAVVPRDVEVMVSRNKPASRSATLFGDARAEADAGLDTAHAATGPDTIAKFLFTSGSTGIPKAVINTHRMLCSNQAMLTAAYRFLEDEPPVIVDWLPWNHTFGGNHNFNMVLMHGGTIHIDDGNPTPPGVPKTVRNLREIAPTIYYNVPKGYEALVPHLRADKVLRDTFFSRVKVLCYAGASLNQPTWDALRELSVEACGERVVFLSSLGSTETSPLALCCTWDFPRPGNIGVPAPGVTLKLVRTEGKLEARLRGPNITPGYWRQDHLTREAFDEEGYYKLGDAVKPVDSDDLSQGYLFDGRLAEDFKLATGTWVSVGPLRTRFIDHFSPYVRDVVLAGADRDAVTALVFPELVACRSLCGDLPSDVKPEAVIADARIEQHFVTLLNRLAVTSAGSSMRVCRIVLLAEPPSIDAGEMTDKGSINQRAVLNRRAALVAELYCPTPSARVIAIEERP